MHDVQLYVICLHGGSFKSRKYDLHFPKVILNAIPLVIHYPAPKQYVPVLTIMKSPWAGFVLRGSRTRIRTTRVRTTATRCAQYSLRERGFTIGIVVVYSTV